MADEGVFEPFPGTDAECFIQWKGTEVCIDIRCPCGETSHFDGGFAYYLRCPSCGAIYEMGTQVKMRRLASDEEAPEAATQTGFVDA